MNNSYNNDNSNHSNNIFHDTIDPTRVTVPEDVQKKLMEIKPPEVRSTYLN